MPGDKLLMENQLYLVHWPVAFIKTDDDNLLPLTAEGSDEAVLDRGVSLVDTWKGTGPIVFPENSDILTLPSYDQTLQV